MNQPTTVPSLEIVSFPDELESIISNIECTLLETLTPRQFALVQRLTEATRLLTEAERVLGNGLLSELKSA